MIDSGASLKDVDGWDQMRFGKKITKSVFYRLKKNYKTLLAETDDKTTNKYTRKAEKDLEPFEEHLKLKICEKTESAGSFKWTYVLLQSLAQTERMKEPFNQCDEIQKMCFTNRYWNHNGRTIKVLIFWTRPVWQNLESPDFLDEAFCPKMQKS